MVGNIVKNSPKLWPFSGDMYFSGKWLIAQYTVSEIMVFPSFPVTFRSPRSPPVAALTHPRRQAAGCSGTRSQWRQPVKLPEPEAMRQRQPWEL